MNKPQISKRVTILSPPPAHLMKPSVASPKGTIQFSKPRPKMLSSIDQNRASGMQSMLDGPKSEMRSNQFSRTKRIFTAQNSFLSPQQSYLSPTSRFSVTRQNSLLKENMASSMIVQQSKPRKYFNQPDNRQSETYRSPGRTYQPMKGSLLVQPTSVVSESDDDDEVPQSVLTSKTPLEIELNSLIQQKVEVKKSNLVQKRQPCLEDFVKGKFLGRGKFGQVFVVKHKITGFVCALKVISKKVIKEEKMEAQFANELKIHLNAKHPNICNLYGFFHDYENIYILMELCSDGMVYNLIKKHRRLPQVTAAYIIRQICQGLKYLHQHGVVHRDIKPENIIIENSLVKICDFGWAAIVCRGGTRKTVCGTPLYLSPEIVKGNTYDQKTDIWAVGILTYELIVGAIPFKIWCEEELSKIAEEEIKFPPWVDITENAKDFILKILQKNPQDRISMTKLLEHPFLANVDKKHFINL